MLFKIKITTFWNWGFLLLFLSFRWDNIFSRWQSLIFGLSTHWLFLLLLLRSLKSIYRLRCSDFLLRSPGVWFLLLADWFLLFLLLRSLKSIYRLRCSDVLLWSPGVWFLLLADWFLLFLLDWCCVGVLCSCRLNGFLDWFTCLNYRR